MGRIHADAEPGILEAIMSSDQMREAIAEPRAVPRQVREYLAEIVVRELVMDKGCGMKDPVPVAKMLGPLYDLYLAAKQTEAWARLKEMSGRNPDIALFCTGAAVTALLEAFDDLADQPHEEGMPEARIAFGIMVMEAMARWGRTPGSCEMPATRPSAPEYVGNFAETVSDLAYESCVPRIARFLEEMESYAEAMELISLLCPGQLWDRGIAGLRRENLGDIRRYAAIASGSRELQQMIDLIGRRSDEEIPGKGNVLACSRSEVHSVVQSGDLMYLLPSELVKLQDPVLKCLFMARWSEGKLLTYQLRGHARPCRGDERQKGPIIALVDTSGSMIGSPELLAKAIVFAVAKQALKSGRDIRVILFSSTGQSQAIDLSGERKMAAEFLEFLYQRFGGGTDFDAALGSGIDTLKDARYRHADLLFVTDGLAKVTDERLLEDWRRLRERQGVRIFTIIVGSDNAGGLEDVSDHTFVLEAGNGPANTMRLKPL